jgi:hypothetical protein
MNVPLLCFNVYAGYLSFKWYGCSLKLPTPLLSKWRCCCFCCRFRKDCELLAGFVHRIEHFITETEDDTDMTGPGWEAAFSVSDWTAAYICPVDVSVDTWSWFT